MIAGVVTTFSDYALVRVGVPGWVPQRQKWRWNLVCTGLLGSDIGISTCGREKEEAGLRRGRGHL